MSDPALRLARRSEFQPFHGTWGPYAAILPGLNVSNSTQWSTCMPDKSSFNSGGPPPMPPLLRPALGGGRPPPAPPSCWNPHYEQIKEWYRAFPSFTGEGLPFTYVNWFEFGWYQCLLPRRLSPDSVPRFVTGAISQVAQDQPRCGEVWACWRDSPCHHACTCACALCLVGTRARRVQLAAGTAARSILLTSPHLLPTAQLPPSTKP